MTMDIEEIKERIPKPLYDSISRRISKLRPAQEKAIRKGLLEGRNLLVCTPTASGKTLIAEMAMVKSIIEQGRKALYIVPLKALANEKYSDFKERYKFIRVAKSIGDLDSSSPRLGGYDLIITTSEKLDSLLRHRASWIYDVGVVVIDEIHIMNDVSRGATIEIIITLLRKVLNNAQIIALSATVGNPEEIADWLSAELIVDDWRPVRLYQGVFLDGTIEYS